MFKNQYKLFEYKNISTSIVIKIKDNIINFLKININ